MEVLIVSKTQRGRNACVGGIIIESNEYVRLLQPDGWDQPAGTPFGIGDIWDIEMDQSEDIELPHIEDVIIYNKEFLRKIDNISEYIRGLGVRIYRGAPDQLFDGLLNWTQNGSGYLKGNANNDDDDEDDEIDEENSRIPHQSVGFWISDEDLILDQDNKHYFYKPGHLFSPPRRLPYVGFEPQTKIIPKGTLLRISLARWWKPENTEMEERCYLQLSGWYNLDESDK